MSFWSRMREQLRKRNPWVAGALNFLAWGFGYLYAGRKKLLGLALAFFVIGNCILGTWCATKPVSARAFLSISVLTWIFLAVALARDAFIETKQRNSEEIKK